MRIKSIVLSMLTLLAISATTMTLTACFGDDYPTDVPKNAVKSRFERPIQASSDV